MTKQKELKASTPSGRSIPPEVAAAAAKLNDVAWRSFPQFEETFKADGLKQMCGKIEKTCRHLDQIIQSGSARDKSRARSVMRAYGRTLELLRELEELRAKAAHSARK
jgi:hypothetical protein